MQIIGRGLIAHALAACVEDAEDSVIFASGVAESACHDPQRYCREIDLLSHWLGQCKRSYRRLVYFSSAGAVYGKAFKGPRDERTPCAPDTDYGRHKLTCEDMIRTARCKHLIIRLPNLVGPRQNPHQLIPALVEQAFIGRAVLFRDATRDLVGVDRFAHILLELLSNAADSETVVLASGISLASTQIFQQIQMLLGTHSQIDVVPRGDRQEFRIDKLCGLAPQTARFTEDSAEAVLATYVPMLAANLRDREALYAPRMVDPSGREVVVQPIF